MGKITDISGAAYLGSDDIALILDTQTLAQDLRTGPITAAGAQDKMIEEEGAMKMTGKTDNTMDLLNLQFTGAENEKQLIVFTVGDEEFGLDVLRVQEIIRYTPPIRSRMPRLVWKGH